MQTVVETPSYLSAADDAGLSEKERAEIVTYLAVTPDAGELMKGTGGVRKFRFAGRGKGKSGGYRVVSFYRSDDLPVFLLTVFSKGERTNLSKAERNDLGKLTETLVTTYRNRTVKLPGEAIK